MISQKIRVQTTVAETTTIDSTVVSKEQVKNFTKIFIENILYERNLLNNSVFKDDVFQGTTIKKIKDFTNNKFAKHFNVYFTGIEDAIEKGYLKSVFLKICRKDNPNEIIEQYELNYIFFDPDRQKVCEPQKTQFSFKTTMDNLKYSVRKYFDPLPPVEELDILIYITLYDKITPTDYIAPYFSECKGKMKMNEDLALCTLGTFKTQNIKVKSKIEGISSNQSEYSTTARECNGTPSICDSQIETIIIPDDDNI